MIISWINTFSLIEFPDQICCVIFTLWCNLLCDYCHNSEFVLPEKIEKMKKNIIPEIAIFNFLEKRKWQLTAVSICGWEPTIQNWLFDFCKKIKSMWFLVKLDTNWQNPDIIKKLLDANLLDYIAMDIKHEIWKFSDICWLKVKEDRYLQSINIILNSKIDYEFRTTVIKWIHSKKNIWNIAKHIVNAKKYFLQNFRLGNTLKKDFSWNSFSLFELQELQKEAKKYLSYVEIRN